MRACRASGGSTKRDPVYSRAIPRAAICDGTAGAGRGDVARGHMHVQVRMRTGSRLTLISRADAGGLVPGGGRSAQD